MGHEGRSLFGDGTGGGLDRWLARGLIIVLVVLLGFSCYLLWRISMVAYRAEVLLVNVSGDIEQVMQTSARVSQRIDELDQAISDLRERSLNMVRPTEVKALLESIEQGVADARAEGKTSPQVEAEISALLEAVSSCGLSFVRRGGPHSGPAFALWLEGKKLLHPGRFASAEEFIDEVATRSVLGTRYQVILKSGEKQDLAEWLKQKLAELQAAKAAVGQGNPGAGQPPP